MIAKQMTLQTKTKSLNSQLKLNNLLAFLIFRKKQNNSISRSRILRFKLEFDRQIANQSTIPSRFVSIESLRPSNFESLRPSQTASFIGTSCNTSFSELCNEERGPGDTNDLLPTSLVHHLILGNRF